MNRLTGEDEALLSLSRRLALADYRFVTITPASHRRVVARRPGELARSLTDVFGWSMPFESELLPADLRDDLRAAGMLDEAMPACRSLVRVSTVRGGAYLHSAFPTSAEGAVFLGPDSYRFADLIADELEARSPPPSARIVDIGVGAGVGAITAALCCPSASIVATDVNPEALRLTRINAAARGIALETIETSGLEGVPGTFDVALLNPPYIIDHDGPTYRHGGAMHGGQLSLDLAGEALAKLSPSGRLILYTGSAIVQGNDALKAALLRAAHAHGCSCRYRELDPDVFGEELAQPQYADVDRIALVAAIFSRDPASS